MDPTACGPGGQALEGLQEAAQFQAHLQAQSGIPSGNLTEQLMNEISASQQQQQVPNMWGAEFQNQFPMMQHPLTVPSQTNMLSDQLMHQQQQMIQSTPMFYQPVVVAEPMNDMAQPMLQDTYFEPQQHVVSNLRMVEKRSEESDFYALMRRIQDGEVFVEESAKDQAMDSETRTTSMLHGADGIVDPKIAEEYVDAGPNWVQEFERNLARELGAEIPHRTDFPYPFEPDNLFLDHPNPFEEAQTLFSAGCMCEAVLAFEAACQIQPDRVEAWQLLGTAQQENEKDALAVIALKEALKLSPQNPNILLPLSVSLINEGQLSRARTVLRDWMCANDAYKKFVHKEPLYEDEGDLDDDIALSFSAAIRSIPRDPDLRAAHAIQLSMHRQYYEAAEELRHALEMNEEDECLWNRHGATLANGGFTQEAMASYKEALRLNPGYARAQYNLGVAYGNVGDHENAARSFLQVIEIQEGLSQSCCNPEIRSMRSTREIWESLRVSLMFMNRNDLVELSYDHQVEPLLKYFQ